MGVSLLQTVPVCYEAFQTLSFCPDGHPNHYPPLVLPQLGLNGKETLQPNRSSLYRMYDSFLNLLPVKDIFLIANNVSH